jgi:predicted nucleic acid-binding protein
VSVFVDTSAFYAVLDADDSRHRDARREWERLITGGVALATTNYVLVEASALLQDRLGFEGVRTFTSDILPVVDIVWIDEGMHRSAWHALLVSSRKGLSLVDCASFEAMRRRSLEQVFCFDRHFAQQGFEVMPGVRS